MLWALALGFSLSICAGFRAIVPSFALALGARLAPSWVPLGADLAWLSSTPALVALGAAMVLEILSDKVPLLDNALDVIQTPVRTAAGAALLVAPCLGELPAYALTLLALIGGSSAFAVSGAKTSLRAAATATTGGLANPLISLVEDFAITMLAILALLLAPLVAILMVLMLLWLSRKIRSLLGRPSGSPASVSPPAPGSAR